MKKWKCLVCGYIHEGDNPPDNCPVCGADSSNFSLVEESDSLSVLKEEKTEQKKDAPYDKITNQILKHHIHPISVHFPNGVVPISFAFVLIAFIFKFNNLAQAAFYNLITVLLIMPIVLLSGYIEWKKKYKGALTNYFLIKIACGIIVTALLVLLIVWYIINPDIAVSSSNSRGTFLIIYFLMLIVVGVAGFIGGKLVFKD
ncbi:MAG: rubredoxin [Desulfobacterales bacterium]|nr:rubredoxin [Desulfobacterales bacterium]